jgi:amidohydrolase
VILALHGIVSRRLNPNAPAVISVGSIHGGTVDNVIPEWVELSGTIRFMDRKVQEQIHTEIESAMGVVHALGGDYELKIVVGSAPNINDTAVVDLLRGVAVDLLGEEHILDPEPGMGGEDFGSFSELAPGAMLGLGSRIEGDERQHHNPRFDIDESCLQVGAAVLAEAALRFLKRGGWN